MSRPATPAPGSPDVKAAPLPFPVPVDEEHLLYDMQRALAEVGLDLNASMFTVLSSIRPTQLSAQGTTASDCSPTTRLPELDKLLINDEATSLAPMRVVVVDDKGCGFYQTFARDALTTLIGPDLCAAAIGTIAQKNSRLRRGLYMLVGAATEWMSLPGTTSNKRDTASVVDQLYGSGFNALNRMLNSLDLSSHLPSFSIATRRYSNIKPDHSLFADGKPVVLIEDKSIEASSSGGLLMLINELKDPGGVAWMMCL